MTKTTVEEEQTKNEREKTRIEILMIERASNNVCC
jgi:hypothetical protein